MSLIEILVVLSIIAMITAGVAVVVIRHLETARRETTITSARALRQAVTLYQMREASGECPTIEALVKHQFVDSASKTSDAWNTAFAIQCSEEGDITIASAGPDRKLGTSDDLRVPDPPKATALTP